MAGKYQSKVFNFLNRQSWRLRDQSAHSWRNLKLTAVWGVQILLYPIYVAFQSSRLIDKQLRQTVNQVVPRLRAAGQQIFNPDADRALTANRPIQRTLESIANLTVTAPQGEELLLLPAESQPDVERALALRWRDQVADTGIANHGSDSSDVNLDVNLNANLMPADPAAADLAAVRIQGVASQLADRRIVLVTTRNQILDVLTVEQQTQLARRMVAEAAIYWQQQRRLRPTSDRWLVSRDLPLPKVRPQTLSPIRAFQQLMGWMQQSSLAIAADLFHESRLSRSTLPAHVPAGLIAGQMDAATEQLLRSAQPSWVAVEAQFYDWVAEAGQTLQSSLIELLMRGQEYFAGRSDSRLLMDRPPSASLPSTQLPLASSSSSSPVLPSSSSFPALPAAQWLSRLDRWFKPSSLQSAAPPAPAASSEPWLQPEDLSSPIRPSSTLPSTPKLPAGSIAPRSAPRMGFAQWILASLSQPHRPSLEEAWEMTDTALLEQQTKNRLPVPPVRSIDIPIAADGVPIVTRRVDPLTPPLSSLDTANLEEAALLPSTWIETEAELVGYVKHPLEQLLEWLDQGMMWIETRITRLWDWMMRPFR